MAEPIVFATDRYFENLTESVDREFDYTRALASGEWKTWQSEFRSRLADLSGLTHIRAASKGLALSPRIVESVEREGHRREKIYIMTEPGIEIPFYLLLPNKGTAPFPLVLTPHGHGRRGKEVYVGNYASYEERDQTLEGERDIALQAVAEGYAVIAMDVRGFWEMSRFKELAEGKNSSCDELQKYAYMYGRTLIGERVHDIGRLIDYAMTRPEIDTDRIAITGNSGGGTVAMYAAALDERIGVSAPNSSFCTFRGSIMHVPHCLCNFIPGIMKLGEIYDVAGLIAPRPVLFVHGKLDTAFPIAETYEAYNHTRLIYEAIDPDRAEGCELFEGEGGHRYYKERVWPFIREHFEARAECPAT